MTDWAGARGVQWRDGLSGIEATLAPVDEPLARALALDDARRIADLGCGGGGGTIAIRRRAAKTAIVHGFDVSAELIETARARDGEITFTLADVATSAPDVPYDRLASRFGVMFFEDPARAFGNLSRWLAPGGRFAFAVWAAPRDNAWMQVVREVAARFVSIPRSDPDAPGPFRYADAARLCALLGAAGFRDVDAQSWRGTLPIGGALSPVEAAAFALGSFGSFAHLFADAPERTKRDAESALAARFASHVHDGAVRLEAHVHVVHGRASGAEHGRGRRDDDGR